MIQPQNLQKGDIIGLVCPAGAIALDKVQKCIETLTQWGYEVRLGKTVGSKKDSFSATDSERLADLQQMMDDPNVKAILCARGGYGMSRIVNDLNFSSFNKKPKWVIGFSDITVLHAALQRQSVMSIHGPMAAAFNKGNQGETYINALKDILEGRKTCYQAPDHSFNKMGTITAPLIGGNLCIIAHLIGSKNNMDTKGKILFLEDVGEYHYNLDRLVIQIVNAGLFENLAGLVIGGFSDMKDASSDFGATPFEILHAHLEKYNYPICFDFPVSHGIQNYPIIQGATYTLNVQNHAVSLTEA